MKLRTGYLISGVITGLILLITFIWSQPDGKLRIVFCNVGQGDAAYIRFPDGRDMLVDGGPDNGRVLTCLGRHMPFWDRRIDIVVLSHPQADHMGGLPEVFRRFSVGYVVRSDVSNDTEGYKSLTDIITSKRIPVRFLTQGDRIDVGAASLLTLWPSQEQIAKAAVSKGSDVSKGSSVLGVSTGQLNDYSLVLVLKYGSFDAVFPGDADSHVEAKYDQLQVYTYPVEVLKVPHHGSKTGMIPAFTDWLKPKVAVISVGKNTYGHPSKEAVNMLQSVGSTVLRTDEKGDITVITDGKDWKVE
jgi:competence protein ComEC